MTMDIIDRFIITVYIPSLIEKIDRLKKELYSKKPLEINYTTNKPCSEQTIVSVYNKFFLGHCEEVSYLTYQENKSLKNVDKIL